MAPQGAIFFRNPQPVTPQPITNKGQAQGQPQLNHKPANPRTHELPNRTNIFLAFHLSAD